MKSHETFLKSGALISTKRNTFLVGHGSHEWSENPNTSSFYFPDFFLKNPKPWLTFENVEELTREKLLNQCPQIQKRTLKWQNPYKDIFRNYFHDLKSTIAQNHLEKAVPYLFEISQDFTLETALCNILHNTQNLKLFIYGFWNEHEGMLGATPEILFTNENSKEIETVACAGTAPLHDACLTTDPKLLREHQLVVDGIRESLSEFATVSVGEITTVQLKRLAHLLTPIKASLHGEFQFGSVVKALHPTPALGVFPKDKGDKWLEDYEQAINRGRYGAPVGYLHGQEAACYVAIRNIQWDAHHCAIGAGGGVVAESTFEQEWDEIQLKLQSIKELLGV